MGLLTVFGNPLNWGTPENNAALPHVLKGGIEQFLQIWCKYRNIDNSPFLWGDELEHIVVEVRTLPDGTKETKLSLNATDILQTLVAMKADAVDWHPEYGSFMVESVPKFPYGDTAESYSLVETNMRQRYRMLDQVSESGAPQFGLTMVTYPLMGVGDFTNSNEPFASPHSLSLFVPDSCINQTHPRFSTLTTNIRKRRGRKVCIQIPLYVDKETMEKTVDLRLNIDATPQNKNISCDAANTLGGKGSKFGATTTTNTTFKNNNNNNAAVIAASTSSINNFDDTNMVHLYTPATDYYYAQYSQRTSAEKMKFVEQRYEACPCPNPTVSAPCVYMDCMAFGMGCNCLQVTMQLRNMVEARHIYDQLVVMCPPFLAITSATPFQKGLLVDSDVRWITISSSVDDRKRTEVPRIIKSRYDSVSCFISQRVENVEVFNDNHIEKNEEAYKALIEAGVDEILAQHIAYLFIRDPLVVYDQAIDIDNRTRTDHFESIQSTNWQTVRFKPPPPNSNIGWRVEFRVMDILPTPFENAAFSVFVALLTKAIIQFELFFYTRMSLVDENMGKAHKRNPCNERYAFRKNPFTSYISTSPTEVVEMTVDEIFNGTPDYIGLVNIVRKYLISNRFQCPIIERYLNFISLRAAGKIPTTANYWRNFIMKHPDYKHDSRITPTIALDIVERSHNLATGVIKDESYIPSYLLEETTPCTAAKGVSHSTTITNGGQKRDRVN